VRVVGRWLSLLLLAAGLVATPLVAVTQCGGGPSTAACAEASICIPDPGLRCVNLPKAPCRSSGNCASGLACFPYTTRTCTDAGPCVGVTDYGCSLEGPAAFDQNALVRGFGVGPFDIALGSTGSSAAVTWSNLPAGASQIACTLFKCAPQVMAVDGVLTIVDYDKCAVSATTVGAAADGQFDLGDTSLQVPPVAECASPYPQTAAGPAVLTVVSVGCLAYDDTGLVGATLLKPVDPSLTVLKGDVTSNCKGTTPPGVFVPASSNCVLEGDSGALGWCAGERCLVRCTPGDDCVVRDASAEGGTRVPCTPIKGVGFGVCGWDGGA
jgi:hypothetical protein